MRACNPLGAGGQAGAGAIERGPVRAILVIAMTVLLDLLGFGLVIPLLSFYAESFGASPLQVTLLMACYSLSQFLFGPIWGALSDHQGRRPVLLFSIGMTALMLAAFATAPSLWALFVTRALHGVFAANLTVAQAYIADITTPQNRARGMGLFGAAFGVGFAVGPWLGGELSGYGLAAPIWAAAALSALNFVLAVALLPEPERRGPPPTRRPSLKAAREVLANPTVGSSILLAFGMTFAFSMMESTFALYQEHAHHLDARQVGRALGFVGLVSLIVQGGLIGPLVRRFTERRLIRMAVPVLGLALLVLPWAPPWVPLLATCAVLATAQGLTYPSLNALISRGAPPEQQGLVLGTSQSLSSLARAVGPALAGVLFTSVGRPAPFFASSAVVLLGGALAWRGLRTPAERPPMAGVVGAGRAASG